MSSPTTPDGPNSLSVDLTNVQGNILGGFLKDHQRFLFCQIGDLAAARPWLTTMAGKVATASDVTRFNALYGDFRVRLGEGVIQATWVNLALTPTGLAKLLPPGDVAGFEPSFTTDITTHAPAVLNDPPAAGWIAPFNNPTGLDLVLIVASDDRDDLDRCLAALRANFEAAGVREVHCEEGEARADDPGHEHFGYKDGVSQPAVSLTGAPYTDLDSPWRFVICSRLPVPVPPTAPAGPYPAPTPPPPVPDGPPAWAHEGSYLVYRRLHQDVAAFEAFRTAQPKSTADRLVGRAEDGTPLDPAGAAGSANDWTFADDTSGAATPLAAHIRKVNPRSGAESAHRIMRRGIAYGSSYREGADPASPQGAAADRGLQFLCYQASLATQFEFLQSSWCNNQNFPSADAGEDPLIGQPSGGGHCQIALTPGATPTEIPTPLVTTTASLYLFQPSIAGLRHLGGAT